MAGTFNLGGLFGDGDYAYVDGQLAVANLPAGSEARQWRPASLTQTVIVGGVPGPLTVTGISVGDVLLAVTQYVGAGVAVTDVADLTSEFTVTAADTIDNTGGTDTTGDKLQVWWLHKT